MVREGAAMARPSGPPVLICSRLLMNSTCKPVWLVEHFKDVPMRSHAQTKTTSNRPRRPSIIISSSGPSVRLSKMEKQQLRTVPKTEKAPASWTPPCERIVYTCPCNSGLNFLIAPFCTLVPHARKDLSPLESGGDDGARTRDLCRDSARETRN
jgi:hypothetical protein